MFDFLNLLPAPVTLAHLASHLLLRQVQILNSALCLKFELASTTGGWPSDTS
jgi:hypothetical protein